jgi:P4 family phage/plasmid primase-like protien
MDTTCQYQDLNEFLAKHNANARKDDPNTSNQKNTHTRIPSKNSFAGSYIIPKEEEALFYRLYYEHVFVKKKLEHLTEKQLVNDGPIIVDFDFRYSHDVEKRQHTEQHIQDLINLVYLELLKEFFVFEKNKSFPVYVMEKPNVNRLQDGSVTKDGIHIIIGIKMSKIMQEILREKVMAIINEIWDLPLVNDWESVLDLGVTKGSVPWQMYGSRKPEHEAYQLTQYYMISYDESDGQFMMEEKRISDIDLSKDLYKLSARYDQHPEFEINPSMKSEIERRESSSVHKSLKNKRATSKTRLVLQNEPDEDEVLRLEDIRNIDDLTRAVNRILSDLRVSEYELKEIHEYTQILPGMFYEPGSHDLNRKVAFALKQTDERLFLSWVMLRSKASDFDYDTIPDLHQKWSKYFKVKPDGVTKQSIMYWAKQYSPEEFIRIKRNTVNYYIDETISSPTDFDFANVLFQMYKHKYVCSGIIEKSWYVFNSHYWEKDKGMSLRYAISTEIYALYREKMQAVVSEMQTYDPADPRYEELKKMNKHMLEVTSKLKRTNDKNNIMREAMEIFYDKDFNNNVDKNKYLLCCTNGVLDFKNRVFRDGLPSDYITKCTHLCYNDFDPIHHIEKAAEITELFNKIYQVPELNRYMWDHLSGSLIGENINQTFNIYLGNGSNGKSKITKLMSLVLGDYYGTVPIALITERRNGIGGTSSEVMNLKGVRYAVMQEPTKEVVLNDGVMKELTGGDPIVGRQLYKEAESFIPQFDLCVCTNILPLINSNDDGTWRRIRIVKHMSKFVDPTENVKPSEESPYIFPKDKSLEDKLPGWAETFLSMLVKRAFETQGKVEDCPIVMMASNNYRQREDHIASFVLQMIEVKDGEVVKRQALSEEFKKWYSEYHNSKRIPKGIELFDYMDKKFGQAKKDGWHGVAIIYPDTTEFADMNCY